MTAMVGIAESPAPVALLELAHRTAGSVDVTLYWDAAHSEVMVELIDRAGGASFQLVVPSERALDAFHHPYAYASAYDAPSSLQHCDVWTREEQSYGVRVDWPDV